MRRISRTKTHEFLLVFLLTCYARGPTLLLPRTVVEPAGPVSRAARPPSPVSRLAGHARVLDERGRRCLLPNIPFR